MTVSRLRDTFVTCLCRLLGLLFPHSPIPSPLVPSPSAIVILKPCCLGDVLLATPLVAALRHAYPQARLAFAVGAWSRPIIEHNPHVDEIIDCGRVGSGPYGLGDYLALVSRLRAGRFDTCFVLERSPLMTLIPFLAGIPRRIGLDSSGRGFSLTVPVPLGGIKHEVEVYLDTARAVGVEIVKPRLEFRPTDAERRRATELAAGLQSPIVAIHPAGGVNPGLTLLAKRWPPDRWAALADRFIDEHGAQILLIGGPGDEGVAEQVKSAMYRQAIDLTGKLDLGETAALLERCTLFIGHDTGVMHLAVAVGTPVVAIFGPSDPKMYGPLPPPQAGEGRGGGGGIALGGTPREEQGRLQAVHAPRSTTEVTIDMVWEAAKKLLEMQEA
jgi:lipopolysaccharide heptosyltransferase II